MPTKKVEKIIMGAIHEAFTKYPEGDGILNLDYLWIQPDQSAHLAKAVVFELAANGFEIVMKR